MCGKCDKQLELCGREKTVFTGFMKSLRDVFFRYEKSCIEGSINVPYSGVHLGQHELRALGLHPHKVLQIAIKVKKTVVVASAEDETAQLVSVYL